MALVDLNIVDIITQNKNIKLNDVDSHLIVFSLDDIEVKVDNDRYKVDSSKLLFVEQNQEISVLSNNVSYFIINFKGEIVADLFNLDIVGKKNIFVDINDDLRKVLFDIFSYYQKNNCINLYILGLFYQVVYFINNQLIQENTFINENVHIRHAIRYMEINYAQNIGIIDIASACKLNPNYLTNLFQKELGVSPIQYLISIRMSHAKNLLVARRYTLQEIGLRVGYKTASYFSQAFKKFYGMSPKEFLINN